MKGLKTASLAIFYLLCNSANCEQKFLDDGLRIQQAFVDELSPNEQTLNN